ncbi:MAG: amidohydrolase [Oscillospiraceae bacterium]|nr:amidohydrolase [Oscillospiraceae bacterium]
MLRFFNGRILRFENGPHITEDEVHISGDTIVYVGPATAEDKNRFDREIDLHGNLLMPGFKNAHTHTPMTFLRSLADDLPLDRWLREAIWPNEAKLDDEAVYLFTKLGILEYLSSGITASFDMYSHSEAYVAANIDSGFRTVLCSGMNDFDADPTDIERDYLHYNQCSDRISYQLGIHAEYTTGIERLKYMVSLAEKYKAPCWTHLSETKAEVEGCIQRYGMTPPLFLDSIGFFNYGGGGFHCCHMTKDDIDMFADKHLWAVTNPASNLKLASGIAPVARMMKRGVRFAIGTDGASSNNALDMFREMFLTTGLQNVLEDNPNACPAAEVLEMACVNGARCMGLENCDDLAVGKKADLIVIDLNRPNMRPLNSIPNNLVFSGSKENVKITMVNGRVLYEDGRFHIDDDPAELYHKAETFMKERIRR